MPALNETSCLKFLQTYALAKLVIEKGLITREKFTKKIFGGTGDVSEATESDRRHNER